jgi:Chaperone of endosialidase
VEATNGTKTVIMKSTGYVGIGTSTPQDKLQVTGVITSTEGNYTGLAWQGTSNIDVAQMYPNGTIIAQRSGGACLHLTKATGYTDNKLTTFLVNGINVGTITTDGTTTAYNTTSDARLKENISVYEGALAKLSQVKVYDYNYKSDAAKKHQIGFLAQELNAVYPQAVTVVQTQTPTRGQ